MGREIESSKGIGILKKLLIVMNVFQTLAGLHQKLTVPEEDAMITAVGTAL
jgi:hypothetical protein